MLPRKIFENLHRPTAMAILVLFEQFLKKVSHIFGPNFECFTKYDAFCSHSSDYACLRAGYLFHIRAFSMYRLCSLRAAHSVRPNSFPTYTSRIYLAQCNFSFCSVHHHLSFSNTRFQSFASQCTSSPSEPLPQIILTFTHQNQIIRVQNFIQ